MKFSKELIEKMYHEDEMSIREIARELGVSRGQIAHLMEIYDIPRRSYSKSQKVKGKKTRAIAKSDSVIAVEKRIHGMRLNLDFKPSVKKNMLIPIPVDGKSRDAKVVLVISDLHIGDAGHLPKTYWSTLTNAVEVLKNINGLYNLKELNVVLNGDITNGTDVYKYQEFRNLVQRGHWQVFLSEIILKDSIKKLSEIKEVNKTILVRGTHDTLSNNLVLYLKRVMPDTEYLSHGGLFNIGTIKNPYYILFMHGYGYSGSAPISTRVINDVMKISNDYYQRGIKVDRVCTAHTHWISSGFIMNDIYWDTTGGFQKWEYTINQRPCGMIMYLYSGGEVVSIPIRPDPDVEMEEKFVANLEYKNLVYYGNYLLKHVKEIEGVDE